ncbi:hypothetical protein [Bradyrhizobium sp. dw_78]|uniref:hypothetical protein n=1 Tax=Bradyrhizobium sp. dw_78 TaxID=2719793 RepID=UPI001BD54F69|nr:hypothetical protein [Bradyrhizobium sp. dw_78]
MSDKSPPFPNYVIVAGPELWAKILAGEITPYIYSGEARGDLDPVPISAAAFCIADGATHDRDGARDPQLKPYQIMVIDRDRRRPSRIRRRIPVPHWVYVDRKDLPAPKVPRVGPGAAVKYDWDDIEQFIRTKFADLGDFLKPENKTEGWRSQNDLIRSVTDYLERRRQPVPRESQFKRKVTEILKRIRAELPAGH